MELSFFSKFFGYFQNDNGVLQAYTDGLGKGFMDFRHLLWAIFVILITYFIVKLGKKCPKKTKKIIKIILCFMFLQRIVKQSILAYLQVETPYWRSILPVHLCSILIYLLPIVVIFNIKSIKKPTYYLSILGGVITVVLGEYFDSKFMNYWTIEAIFAHSVLIITSIRMLTIEKERFTSKDVFKTIVMILIIGTWATIINCVLGMQGYQTDYLYMVNNILPNNLGGKYFVFIYEIAFFIVLFLVYFLSNKKNKEDMKKEIREKKLSKLLIFINVVVLSTTLILFTNIFAIPKMTEEEQEIIFAINFSQIPRLTGQSQNIETTKIIEDSIRDLYQKDVTAEEEKDKFIIIDNEKNKEYIIYKSDVDITEKIKERIIDPILLKIFLTMQIILIVIDISFILIKKYNRKDYINE